MNTKTKVIIGVVLLVVAVVLVVFSQDQGPSSTNMVPMPSATNPNDPAVKGLSIN